jgi:hypothetical protein
MVLPWTIILIVQTSGSVGRREIFLAGAAIGTYPIVGKILEGHPGLDTTVRVTDFGIVYVSANVANVLLHDSLLSIL